MDNETCVTPPTVHGTVSPKSPSHSVSGSPVDDKSTVLATVDRASPEPNCAICLGKLQNKSFTNSCLHQYCFNCLLEWSKVKAECPLCKQGFQSIIHNVRSIEDYDQYDLLPNETPYHWNYEVPDVQQFRYRRLTAAGNRGVYRLEQVNVLQPLPPSRRPQRVPWTRSRRQIATAEFRRSIYDRNLWVMPLHDITGRYRECSPEFYRNNPAQLHRLLPWLSRELSVLLVNQSRLALILDSLMNMLQYHSIYSSNIRDYLLNTLGGRHVDHFIHELWTFARSPYDMIGFDEMAEYGSFESQAIEVMPSPRSGRDDDSDVIDDDSDVVIISSGDSDGGNNEDNDVDVEGNGEHSRTPAVGSRSARRRNIANHTSQRSQAGDSSHNSVGTANVRPETSHDLGESSDSEDCVIVGYVKPLHERTPEIVQLDSDEDDTEDRKSTHETNDRDFESQTNDAESKEKYRLDVVNPVASTSGCQQRVPDSTAGCSSYIPNSLNNSRTREHRGKKIHSSRSKIRSSKKSARSRSAHSSSSSPFLPVSRHRSRKLSQSSDSSSSSPIRRHSSKGKRMRKKLPYSSDSSSESPVRHNKSRVSHLSKLSCTSDSSGRSPERHQASKERDDTRYTYNSGRSSLDDYSYPLASRMSSYRTPYSSDDESTFDSQHRPKLRSIVVQKSTNTSFTKGLSYPSTSSGSVARHHAAATNLWTLSSRDHKSKHKPRRHEKKKRRRKEIYSSSSSSEDFVVRHTKRRSENTVIYSDSD